MSAIESPDEEAASRSLVARCADGHGRRALDLATGSGSVALALAARGWAVSAVDHRAGVLEVARDTAAERNLVVDWRLARLDALPFDADTFAAITARFGFETTPNLRAAIAEAARCLLSGGLLIMATGIAAPQLPAHTFTDTTMSDEGKYWITMARRR